MEETLNFYAQKKLRQPFLDLYSYELPGLGPFFRRYFAIYVNALAR